MTDRPTPAERLAQAAQGTPLHLYGQLFIEVQMQRVFGDGKTFVDATPRHLAPAALCALYAQQRQAPGFSLHAFVLDHFDLPGHPPPPAPQPGIHGYIRSLWPLLLRQSQAAARPHGSLLSLPHPYVVPGGRFREVYYWDSFFTMQGLMLDGQPPLAQAMLDNFAALIDRFGSVPNSNRRYMLTRSQPPFFFRMVQCVCGPQPGRAALAYLPQLVAEHRYWMAGAAGCAPGQAAQHVVRLPGGALLNRYWDQRDDPREESHAEDVHTASLSTRPATATWRDLRAGAESGWDFSSRWCAQAGHLHSIETTAILPVDLNALLWGLESCIAGLAAQDGQAALAAQYQALRQARAEAMHRLMWSEADGAFLDCQAATGQRRSQLTAAACVPLYLGLASQAQADRFAQVLRQHLLAPHGLRTTTVTTGQQWDKPNGWAPLQVMAVEGLLRYGHTALAHDIAGRWLALIERVYQATGKLLEKYDVEQDQPGGGGEYPTQDGFGWTNASHVILRQLTRA